MTINLRGNEARRPAAGLPAVVVRAMKDQPHAGIRESVFVPSGITDGHGRELKWPFGKPGEVCDCRETWAMRADTEPGSDKAKHYLLYKADDSDLTGQWHDYSPGWHSSATMPQWAVRTHARIVSVTAKLVTEVTEEEAIDANVEDSEFWNPNDCPSVTFSKDWDSTHKPPLDWASKPWVWVARLEKTNGM